MVKEGRSIMPHTATQVLSIYQSCGQISWILVGRYIIPLFRRRGFPNALHPIADVYIKAPRLVPDITKKYSAIGVVGDFVRVYALFLVN